MKTLALCVLIVLLGCVVGGPAWPIWKLQILTHLTKCHSDGTMSMFYKYMGYGTVYTDWSSGSTSCTTHTTYVDYGRIVQGELVECRVGTKTGKFTVKYYGNRNLLLCNSSYDMARFNNCRTSSHFCG